MMTSFDDNYQNALRQAIVLSTFSFVKNRSCVTQICITKIAAKCILVVVFKWRPRANGLAPKNLPVFRLKTIVKKGAVIH